MFETRWAGWDVTVRRLPFTTVHRPEEAIQATLVRRPAGEGVLSGIGDVHRQVALTQVGATARGPGLGVGAFTDTELAESLHEVDALTLQVERLATTLVAEIATRKLHLDSGHTLRDWIAAHCPWASPATVNDMATVAQAVQDNPDHAPIAQALAGGALPVRRAARVLRALTRVRPAVDQEAYAQDVRLLLDLAQRSEITDTELRRVTDHLIALALPQKDLEDRARAAHEMRGVNESSLADGSLIRFIVTAEAAGAAVLRAVLASPLAAPAPDADGPDPRTATQRRYDALITMIQRGVSAGESVPVTAKAKVVITIAYDAMLRALVGWGTTPTGDVLTPGQVRRLSCGADLVPAVLGTDSEPLDLGRAVRTATPGQRTALTLRDQHCTYPGCTVPPDWCDAHHVVWWIRGGRSDLSNYALLCPRHHTLVHDRDVTATVSATGVIWQTTPT